MYYMQLFESNAYEAMYSNEDIISKLDEIKVYDKKTNSIISINPNDVIKVCNDALYKMHRDFPYLYRFLAKCKVMYIPLIQSEITNTMAVDSNNNLWINMSFVYSTLNMNVDRVFGILFHEMFHVFFQHNKRFSNIYSLDMFSGNQELFKKAMMKSNVCADYEVNASMVEDGIVTEDFWKSFGGLYKKEYTGMTYEDILKKHGDDEYKEYMKTIGCDLDPVEEKILDAIEKASKVLLDPEAEDDEKSAARKEFNKTMDKILGKENTGEKTLKETLEELSETQLGDISNLAYDLEDLADDLRRDPSKMTPAEIDNAMNDLRKFTDDLMDNAEEISEKFGKEVDDLNNDINNVKKSMSDVIKKISSGGLTNDEKKELIQKAKDSLEDLILDENEKAKAAEKRKERDEKREAEKKEKFKKNHPFRELIKVFKNFLELHSFETTKSDGSKYEDSLISDNTNDIIEKIIDELENLTEYKFSELKKKMVRELSNKLDELKESFLPDLVTLLDNETILNKTKEDMQNVLDSVFDDVFNAFRRLFDDSIDENAKSSLIKNAARRLRLIGKILKTQKKWKASDEFKKAYKDEMKRLMDIFKTDGAEKLFKELWDNGVINPMSLDERGKEIFDKIIGEK